VQAAQYKTPLVAAMRILGIRALAAHTNAAKNLRQRLASARQEGRVPRPLAPGLRGLWAHFEPRTTDSLRGLCAHFEPRTTDSLRGLCAFYWSL
jgi:hypothetical protein